MLPVGRSSCGFNLRVLLSLLEVWVVSGEIMDPIYWNSMNRRFQDAAGYVLYPQIGDRIDLICPRSVPPGPYSTEEYEYYRLYLVTQEQSELCNTVMSPTILLTCDKPDHNTRFTIKFQEFSPNLWGLEFKPNQDYYIITTSEGGEDGLENRNGGACITKSMRVTLKVGQDPNAPLRPKGPYGKQDPLSSTVKPGLDPNIRVDKENSSVFLANSSGKGDSENGRLSPSNIPLIAGSAGGAAFLLLVIAAIVVVVCYRRRRSKLAESHRPAMHLSTLSSPKRGGGSGGNNNGSEPSDIIIPLRTSDSAFCPHYEKVSGDYGHPVYIVQEMPPQSPANIYYKSFLDRPVAASEKLGKGGLAQKDGSEKERNINKNI